MVDSSEAESFNTAGRAGWTIHSSVDIPRGQEPEDVDVVRAEIRAAYIAVGYLATTDARCQASRKVTISVPS